MATAHDVLQMGEQINIREQTQKRNHRINPAFPTFTEKKSKKKKVFISVCSCVGRKVQGSEQA